MSNLKKGIRTMGLFQKELYSIVLATLTNHPETRDSDATLYARVCLALSPDLYIKLESHNPFIFLKMMEDKEVPDYQSITRYRRLAQHKHIHLRGAKWAERRRVGEQLHTEFHDNKQEAV